MFQVPESKRSVKQNRFEFTIGKQKFSVPQLKYASAGAMEQFEQGREMTAMLMCCENDTAKAAVRELDGEQLGDLLQAWYDASNLSAGESRASSD